MRRVAAVGAIVALLLALTAGAAPAANLEPRVAALEAKVADLTTRVAALEARPTATPAPTPVATPTVTPPPPPPPPPPPTTAPYGTVAADSKANLRIGVDGIIRHRFVASTSSTPTSARWSQRGGAGYSAGTGGKIRITIRSGATVIASRDYVPGNPVETTFYDLPFTTTGPLVAGQTYDLVFENIDPAPASNFISVNDVAVLWGDLSQPVTGTSVIIDGPAASTGPAYCAVFDITYADGTHDGQGYIEAMIANYGPIGGQAQVRQTFTPGARSVTSASVRVKRISGTAPLTLSLVGPGGVLATGDVSGIPLGAPLDGTTPSGWATITFPAVALAAGTAYSLVLASAGSYSATPVREGTDTGDLGGTGNPTGFRTPFINGRAQKSADGGATWADLYPWSPNDLQFVLR